MSQSLPLTDNRVSAFSALLFFVLITALLPLFPGLPYDVLCWREWSTYIARKGVGEAYGSGSNYMPLYHYVLWAYGKLMGSPAAIKAFMPYLRTVTVLFDFWGLWMVWQWARPKMGFALLLLISVLNLAYQYNSVIWGQVDGIVATLVFAALYMAWKRNLVLSGLACVLSVNMKLQAIVFVPLWGLLALDAAVRPGGLRATGKMLAAMAGLQTLILLPYALTKGGLAAVWDTVRYATETFPVVSKNAFNFWSWFVELPDFTRDNELATNYLTYRDAGLMLFFVSSFLVMFPLLRQFLRRLGSRERDAAPLPKEQVWLTAALIGLLFFFFNTQMHERYSHPAFIFITAYAFCTGRYLPYLLFSVAYFLNLEAILGWLKLSDYERFPFNQGFVAALFAVLLVYLYARLLGATPRRMEMPAIAEEKPVSVAATAPVMTPKKKKVK